MPSVRMDPLPFNLAPWFSHFCIYIGDVSDKIEHVTSQVVVSFILRLPIVPFFLIR